MSTLKRLLVASAVFAFVVSLVGCNTLSGAKDGFAEDLRETGDNIEKIGD
ncbi:MAG: hypothetical protein AAF797_15665 [Planctomycetota bacterium]